MNVVNNLYLQFTFKIFYKIYKFPVSYTHLEIKSLLMHPNFKKEVNKHALKPYLTFQYSVLDETFFKGVFKLKPGHFMVYKDGKIKIEQYWDVEFNQENIDLQESINRIKDAVSESVEVHSHSAVSYTHLDVYKRQHLEQLTTLIQKK